jgi:hypothetical protein
MVTNSGEHVVIIIGRLQKQKPTQLTTMVSEGTGIQ